MFKQKLKAFSLHLLLSVVLVTLLLSTIVYFWFPLEYLGITDFKEIVAIILTIDLVLGPLLTFIIFNPGKKGLRFDLTMIALFQVSALSYGVYALYQIHPIFMTYKHDAFTLVNANDVNPQDAKHDVFKVSKFSSGNIAFAKMPDDPEEKMSIMLGVDMKGEPDIDRRAELYEPLTQHIDAIIAKGIDPDIIFSEKKLNKKTTAFMKKHKNINDYAYVPLLGIGKYGIVVLDKKTAKLVTTIKTNPLVYEKHASK